MRTIVDQRYLEEFVGAIRRHFPGCPPQEAGTIARHACLRGSGRVGRSAAAKDFAPAAVELAVRAHVRHTQTRYDRLLARGVARDEARAEVGADLAEVMERWLLPSE